MGRCDVCGNDYDKAIEVHAAGAAAASARAAISRPWRDAKLSPFVPRFAVCSVPSVMYGYLPRRFANHRVAVPILSETCP